MITLALVFEKRNDQGELEDYAKFELDEKTGRSFADILHFVDTTPEFHEQEIPEGEWTLWLLDFFAQFPDFDISQPADCTICPLCSGPTTP